MTAQDLAALLYDVAMITTTTGTPPDRAWVKERTNDATANLYERRLNPATVAETIVEALLDAGAYLDFARYEVDPDNPHEVWSLLETQLSNLLNTHNLVGDERAKMRELVETEYFARF